MHGDRIGRIRLFAEGENLTKIQFPRLPDTAMPELILQEGSAISFDFGNVGGTKTVPNQVNVYAVDYVLIVSAQESQNTFELSGITGIKTLEVHVLLPDNNNNTFLLPSW